MIMMAHTRPLRQPCQYRTTDDQGHYRCLQSQQVAEKNDTKNGCRYATDGGRNHVGDG
jgi:hypothetical protein